MQPKLIVVGGKASKREVLLKLPCTIGRSRAADLTAAHPMVSRKHCEVYERDGLVMVRDLGSLNGTYLGDRRVREAPLPPGKEFTIGPLTFRVAYDYEGDLDALPAVVFAEDEKQPDETPKTLAMDPVDMEVPDEPSPTSNPTEVVFEPDADPAHETPASELREPGDSALDGFLEDLQ